MNLFQQNKQNAKYLIYKFKTFIAAYSSKETKSLGKWILHNNNAPSQIPLL
jgi:hypothetical protein